MEVHKLRDLQTVLGHSEPHREYILEGGLQEISQLLLGNELEERWLQRISSVLVKKIHRIRSICYEKGCDKSCTVVFGGGSSSK
jgi:hypothetical protein